MNIKSLIAISIITCLSACSSNDTKSDNTSTDQEINSSDAEGINPEYLLVSLENNVNKIDAKLSKLVKKTTTIEEGGPDPTELIGYFDGSALVKVTRTVVSGHSSKITTYYLEKEKVFFAREVSNEEASVNGPFTTKEESYYITNEELLSASKKEKTFKTIGEINMEKVPAKNITDAIKNKSELVSKHNKMCTSTIAQLKGINAADFSDGRWISTDDANAGIEIKNKKWTMFYKGQPKRAGDVYDAKLTTTEANGKSTSILTLTNSDGAMKYSVLRNTDEVLSMIYLARGNTLTYKKEKDALTSFTDFPSEIDGCACYYSNNKGEFKNRTYVYADDYDKVAVIYLNGEKLKFNLSKTDEKTKGTIVQTFNNSNGYELKVEAKQTGQVDETWQKTGKLTLKLNDKLLLEKEVVGECGC